MTKNIFKGIEEMAKTIAACKLANEYVEKQKQEEARLRKLEEEKLKQEAYNRRLANNPVIGMLQDLSRAIESSDRKRNAVYIAKSAEIQKNRLKTIAWAERNGDYELASKLRARQKKEVEMCRKRYGEDLF